MALEARVEQEMTRYSGLLVFGSTERSHSFSSKLLQPTSAARLQPAADADTNNHTFYHMASAKLHKSNEVLVDG